MGEATGKNGREASSRFHGARSETGRGGDGPAEILSGRMGVHRDIPKVGVLSERGGRTPVCTPASSGGNSLINTFHSQGPVGDFEGLLVMTWDAREKAYKACAFANDFPGALVETGQFEGDVLVYRSEFPVEGATLKLRNVTRLTAPGKIESEEYMAMKDAPESLLVRVEAKKR